MSMRRWDPFRDLLSIQSEINRLFGRTYGNDVGETAGRGDWAPSFDVYETPDKFTVLVELPGMTTDQVDITVEDGVLAISGERKFYDSVQEESFHRIERRFGAFQRKIVLPQQCDVNKVQATMNNGLLTIDVPKVETARPKRIEVTAAKG